MLARVPFVLDAVVLVVAAWTVALLGLRLWSPRPTMRRLSRQPGWVASVGATLGLSYFILNHEVQFTIFRVTGGSTGESTVAEFARQSAYVIRNNPNVVGLTVAMGWLILSLGHRWRPEPSWIDRAGRIVGAYWLLMIVVPLIALALLSAHIVQIVPTSLETPFEINYLLR